MSAEALIREALDLAKSLPLSVPEAHRAGLARLDELVVPCAKSSPAEDALDALIAERDGWIADCSIAEENARTALEAAGRARAGLELIAAECADEEWEHSPVDWEVVASCAAGDFNPAWVARAALSALGEPVCPPGEGSAGADSTTAKGTGSPNVKDPEGSEAASESEKT